MANRYLPFGYVITNGEICVNEPEAELIKAIFELYAKGKSYSEIAQRCMLTGIRYNTDSDKWNKNMVKRIIENDKYTGKNDYPKIIDEKLYNKANKTRLSKNVKQEPEKSELDKFIRLHSECPDCSSPLKRQHQGHDEKVWTAYKCTNPVCPAKSVKENRLYQLITEMTNLLIQNLDLANEPTITEIPDDTLADDKANEIYIKMAGEYDKDDVLKSLYELARLKFQSSTITDMSAVTDRIKKELCKYGNCERVSLPLMQKIVSKFYVGGDNELKMKLINGKTITRSVI